MLTSDEVYAVCRSIEKASGNQKRVIMKQFPEIQPYLEAAYDPFKMYYVRPKSNYKTSTEVFNTQCFDKNTWNLLTALTNRVITGDIARQMVDDELERLSYNSATLLVHILNKDLRMGTGVKTINKVFSNLIPTHDIMRAKLFDKNHIKFPCWASPKIDGVRVVYRNGKMYSRNGHEYPGLETLINCLGDFRYALDGELTIPKKSFQKGSGKIRSHSSKKNAVFSIWDVPNINMDFKFRLSMVEELCLEESVNIIRKVPHKLINSLDEAYEYYGLCRELGYEGTVLKAYNYKYRDTRGWDWQKMKPSETLDLKVQDFYEGAGKYQGMLGGVVVQLHAFNDPNNDTVVCGVGSGFSDYQRKIFWNEPKQIVGKVIEVKFMEFTDDGNLRHPVFIKIREDKS